MSLSPLPAGRVKETIKQRPALNTYSTKHRPPFEPGWPWLIITTMSVYLPPKRPRGVTLTIWGVILCGLWNIGKVIALLQAIPLLSAWHIQPDPQIQAFLAGVWAVLFFLAAWFLKQKKPVTLLGTPVLLLLYGSYTIGLRFLFTPGYFEQGGWFLTAIFFLSAGGFAFVLLKRAEKSHYFIREE